MIPASARALLAPAVATTAAAAVESRPTFICSSSSSSLSLYAPNKLDMASTKGGNSETQQKHNKNSTQKNGVTKMDDKNPTYPKFIYPPWPLAWPLQPLNSAVLELPAPARTHKRVKHGGKTV